MGIFKHTYKDLDNALHEVSRQYSDFPKDYELYHSKTIRDAKVFAKFLEDFNVPVPQVWSYDPEEVIFKWDVNDLNLYVGVGNSEVNIMLVRGKSFDMAVFDYTLPLALFELRK